MAGRTARVTRMRPKRFTSNMSRILASSVSSKNVTPPLPALFTSTSMSPNASTAARAASSNTAWSVCATSSWSVRTRSRASRGAVNESLFRVVATTRSPWRSAASAVAFPIPFPAPVMNQTLGMRPPAPLDAFPVNIPRTDAMPQRETPY